MAAPRARKAGSRSKKEQKRSALGAAILRHPGRMIAGAAFVAALSGIVANALFMQTARHPAPIFSSAPTPTPSRAAPPRAVAPVPPPRPADAIPPQNIPVPPVQSGAPAEAGRDQIGALLRNGAPAQSLAPDAARILAAQKALQKLGYVLKPDGVMGATTRQALQMFEQSRKLPPTGELSARVIRELSAQSGVAVP